MKDRALEIVASRPPAAEGRNVLREYLQSRVLGAMQEAGTMVPLAFMGGTALRFLYRIPRFSEALDFTVERNLDSFDFRGLVKNIERTLVREGYALRTRVSDKWAVAKAHLGFVGLPAEAGLSPPPDEILSLRLEVDTNPPAGAGLAITLVNRHGPLCLQHHNLPSLFENADRSHDRGAAPGGWRARPEPRGRRTTRGRCRCGSPGNARAPGGRSAALPARGTRRTRGGAMTSILQWAVAQAAAALASRRCLKGAPQPATRTLSSCQPRALTSSPLGAAFARRLSTFQGLIRRLSCCRWT
ncbi:MAG: nucleotidyl transferase AbiEii/AbiGii toxin family protein [Deltaproteobacteria bacterium]|nr:nucleotidyl transferase AbiEii/AbiGii toxin family protein [Deltaproteobacteria bacterium]